MLIRAAVPGDAAAIADLHLRNLPHGESDFAQLGAPIVRRFYANVISRGVGSAFCAVENNVIAAFVLVTANVRNVFSRSLLAGPLDLAFFLTRANPRGVVHALRTKLGSRTLIIPEVPEAVYLVVDPAFRGRGLGALLMERAEAWFRAEGLTYYELNAHANNEAVLKIHFGNGHQIVREYMKDGVLNYTLRKQL